jgi:peptidyl-prolyl cis-trans isomerase B (cyclophilin B)
MMHRSLCATRLTRLWVLALLVGYGALAGAQVQPPPCELPPPGVLRAELNSVRPVYCPDRSIALHFSLTNLSDQPVTLPLDPNEPEMEGVGLPVALVFGPAQHRSLFITYESEAPKEVSPPASYAKGSRSTTNVLRLAAHASVGCTLDLRDCYPAARYVGPYHVEWRPLEGRLGVATTEFRVESRKDAIMVTDLGKMTFVLDYELAPQNVENFVDLVRDKFYDGKIIHRVIPGFVLQGGCPKGDGTGMRADGRSVPAELRDVAIDMGMLLMAHKPNDPNSASCQFFVALGRIPELDGQYTVIGRASDEDSLRTLQKLADVATDKRDRPTSPLPIRSINLVDNEQTRTTRVETAAQKQAARLETPPATQPAEGP